MDYNKISFPRIFGSTETYIHVVGPIGSKHKANHLKYDGKGNQAIQEQAGEGRSQRAQVLPIYTECVWQNQEDRQTHKCWAEERAQEKQGEVRLAVLVAMEKDPSDKAQNLQQQRGRQDGREDGGAEASAGEDDERQSNGKGSEQDGVACYAGVVGEETLLDWTRRTTVGCHVEGRVVVMARLGRRNKGGKRLERNRAGGRYNYSLRGKEQAGLWDNMQLARPACTRPVGPG